MSRRAPTIVTAGLYFDADAADEHDIHPLADALYRRADWPLAQNQGATVTPRGKLNAAAKSMFGVCCMMLAPISACFAVSWEQIEDRGRTLVGSPLNK